MREIGFLEMPGLGISRLWWPGGRSAYVSAHLGGFTEHFLLIVDIQDKTKPQIVGKWWLPGMNRAAGVRGFEPKEIAFWVLRVPQKLIDPRPNISLAAQTCDVYVTLEGIMYVSDWNSGLPVLGYKGSLFNHAKAALAAAAPVLNAPCNK